MRPRLSSVAGRLREVLGSYRTRLALGYVLAIALLAGVWAWSLYGPLADTVAGQQRAHLRSIARAGVLALGRAGVPAQATARDLASSTGLRVTVVAADGRVLADTAEDPAAMANHRERPEVRAALGGRDGADARRSATTGVDTLYVAVPASLDGAPVALRVAEPVAAVDRIAAGARATGLGLLAAALAAAAVASVALARAVARPVVRLKRAAEAMASGDLRTPVPPTSGELAGLGEALGAMRDEIRARMDQLEAGSATLRTALDGLDDTVLLLDGEAVSVANAAASRMFRTPPGGWTGTRVASAGLPASLTAGIAGALARRAALATEVGPDPENRYFRVTAHPLGPAEQGQPQRTLLTIADVTEARRFDRVRRDFVANASHELKTPTATIQLLAESISASIEDGDPAMTLEFARSMGGEADRLRRLVTDLLDLSRLETTPTPGTVTDVRAAVDNAMAAHRAAASAAGLALDADDSGVLGQDAYVAAEPADVAVALDNLLANAIAYTESGGVTVSIEADEATVGLVVTDTGIGIPADHMPRVFERFYRVDGARTRDGGGTGLGLALVKHVAERAGGTVSMVSEPGRGTTVTVRLPRATVRA